MTKPSRLLIASLCASLLSALSSCAMNPATGSPDLVFMSESSELKIGREMHEKIIESTPIYQDEVLQKYVDSVGQKVAKNSDRPDITYHFTIIDQPDINAFALPGGYVYINRGLIAYLNNEAQLAAVLAHEVGHITARHTVRQKTAKTGASVLSVLSVLATGSHAVGDVTSLWSTAAVMGYGREMELEADGFGAKYLLNSGYDPQAVIDVIGILKDQERFSRYRSREEGKKMQSYHGVFSTHPRNDQRLREAIANVGTLPESAEKLTNTDIFREKISGIIYGVNYQPIEGKPGEKNRFTHQRLGFTLIYPDQWQIDNQSSSVIATEKDKKAELSLRLATLRKAIPPDEYIRQNLGIPLLTQSEAIKQFGMVGHTGLKPANDKQKHASRLSVFYQGRRVYIFEGKVFAGELNDISPSIEEKQESKKSEKTSTEAEETNEQKEQEQNKEPLTYDQLFMSSIRSFRPIRTGPRPKNKSLRFVKANQHSTYAALAKYTRIGKYGEEQLRLLNGQYPRGEPVPGQWIKIVQ